MLRLIFSTHLRSLWCDLSYGTVMLGLYSGFAKARFGIYSVSGIFLLGPCEVLFSPRSFPSGPGSHYLLPPRVIPRVCQGLHRS